MYGCIQVEISVMPVVLKPSISLYCDLGQAYFPLIVDEGYLLVEDNGIVSFLCVDKK
jgi:hypothetical protein